MIQRYRAFYEGKMYGVKAVIWTSRGLYVTLDEGNKAGRRLRGAVLMQSTGLFDVNGKEIFDKDIIKNKDGRLAIVKWHGTYASFVYVWLDELDKNKQDWQPLYLAYMKFEVVGNVYQNPELIEEVNNVDD